VGMYKALSTLLVSRWIIRLMLALPVQFTFGQAEAGSVTGVVADQSGRFSRPQPSPPATSPAMLFAALSRRELETIH
jgi:hypothetical protein